MITLDPPDLVAARRRRFERAADQLGVDAWLFTTSAAVRAATGAWSDDTDLVGEWAWPIVAVGATVIERSRPPDDPALIDDLVDLLPLRGTVAVDRLGVAATDRLRDLRPGLTLLDGGLLLGAAKAPREEVELATLSEAHRRTEGILAAMLDLVQPGVSERDLNAEFAARAAAAGSDRLHVDTVFTVLPRSGAQAPWVRGAWAGHFPYRELTSGRVLAPGDHVAFDAGVGYHGYTADVGWTLRAGDDEPSPDERRLAERWDEVAQRVIAAARPGASVAQMRSAALAGWDTTRPDPWPYPLYVAHGVGTDLAEPPFVGVGFAPEAEETMLLQEGNVLMIEPYVYEEGVGGYRAEYCIAVRDDVTTVVSSLPYGAWPQR